MKPKVKEKEAGCLACSARKRRYVTGMCFLSVRTVLGSRAGETRVELMQILSREALWRPKGTTIRRKEEGREAAATKNIWIEA